MILRNRNFKLSERTIPLEWKIWRSIIPACGEEYIRGIETFSLAARPRVIYRRYVLLRFDRWRSGARRSSFPTGLFPPNTTEFFHARFPLVIERFAIELRAVNASVKLENQTNVINETNVRLDWAKDRVERTEIRRRRGPLVTRQTTSGPV